MMVDELVGIDVTNTLPKSGPTSIDILMNHKLSLVPPYVNDKLIQVLPAKKFYAFHNPYHKSELHIRFFNSQYISLIINQFSINYIHNRLYIYT